MSDGSPTGETAPEGIDPGIPVAPRIWNYWCGGKDNYAADRRIGDQMAAMYPSIVRLARADRAFLGRAVRHLVSRAKAKIKATGIPFAVVRMRNERVKPRMTLRSGAEITRFLDGFDLLDPGVVPCNQWRPVSSPFSAGEDVDEFAGVARKP